MMHDTPPLRFLIIDDDPDDLKQDSAGRLVETRHRAKGLTPELSRAAERRRLE